MWVRLSVRDARRDDRRVSVGGYGGGAVLMIWRATTRKVEWRRRGGGIRLSAAQYVSSTVGRHVAHCGRGEGMHRPNNIVARIATAGGWNSKADGTASGGWSCGWGAPNSSRLIRTKDGPYRRAGSRTGGRSS